MVESTSGGPPNESRHRETWELIPWVVNGRATDADAEAVRAHCSKCTECAEELRLQETLHRAMAQKGGAEFDVEGGWQQVLREVGLRAEPADMQANAASGASTRHTLRLRQVLVIMAVEALVLAFAGAGLLYGSGMAQPRYQTLATPTETPRNATVRVVVSRELTVAQLEALLRSLRMRIVEGPSELGGFALAPTDLTVDSGAALARLRATPGVLMAESIR